MNSLYQIETNGGAKKENKEGGDGWRFSRLYEIPLLQIVAAQIRPPYAEKEVVITQ